MAVKPHLHVFMIFLIIHLATFLLTQVESVRVCRTFPDYFFENNPNCWENTDSDLNATQIIEKWGFNAEEHYLTTEDGYEILVVRAYSEITQSTPIVMGHGIYMNCLGFIDMGNKSLPYILNTLGYDVWLINFRGTRYSNKHVTLTVDDAAYWKFSFNEMGVFDVPKVLNLVYQTTNQKAIYIGYSMGSTISYVYSTTYPQEATQLLKGIISLAPVAYLNNIESILRYAAPAWPLIKPLVQLIWNGQVLPRNNETGLFCNENVINMYICQAILAPVFGPGFEQMDPEYLPVTNILNPDTIGIDVVTHFDQIVLSGRFQKFDYGLIQNIVKYGTLAPPIYQLSNINIPLSLFVGPNDYLATEENAERLCSEAVNTNCTITLIDNQKWSHGDFVTGKDIVQFVNYPVYQEISRIEDL